MEVNSMMTPPEVLEQISGRVEELERRVSQLEQRSLTAPAPIKATTEQRPLPAIVPEEAWQLGPTLTVIGIALLGIAGAYVLRALAATAVLPRIIVAVIGAVYATGWAVAATRTSRRFAAGLYAATSVLILAPMLWEMCLRFQAMSALVAAVILGAYVVISSVTARGSYSTPAFSLLFAGSSGTALALCIGIRSMIVFIAILLAMALFAEIERVRSRAIAIAPFVLLTADAAVWSLLFIYRAPVSARPEYPALNPLAVMAAPLLLFFIQAIALAVNACIRRHKVTVSEALQAMASFGLLTIGVFWITPSLAPSAVGSLCLVLCAACYWIAFDPLHRVTEIRNFRLFATWAVLLLAWGLYLVEPASLTSVTFAVVAVAAIMAAPRLHSTTLESHAIAYLALAAFACGLPAYEWHAMIANAPSHPGWPVAVVAGMAIAAYAICREQKSEDTPHQLIHFAFALLATLAACALLSHGLMAVASLALHPEAFHIALLRTVAICAVALALAIAGVHLRRSAMTRVAHTLLVFVVLKLVFEDIRHGHLGFLAASIGIVALTLIAVPRMARTSWSGDQVIR
jgi:hypothetical protein